MLDIFLSSKATPVDDKLPSDDEVKQALDCSVKDSIGMPHLLSSLMSSHRRTILVFVRHHHCGMCIEYVRSISKSEKLRSTYTSTTHRGRPSTSMSTSESTKSVASPASDVQVIVIGHGSHQGINRYKEMSDCVFDMYTDEDKKVYSCLGLTRRFLGQTPETKRASYLPEEKSNFAMAVYSAYKMMMSGSLFFKGGDFALLGGEFVIDKGEPIMMQKGEKKLTAALSQTRASRAAPFAIG
jgi:hypothetical protein